MWKMHRNVRKIGAADCISTKSPGSSCEIDKLMPPAAWPGASFVFITLFQRNKAIRVVFPTILRC